MAWLIRCLIEKLDRHILGADHMYRSVVLPLICMLIGNVLQRFL